MSNGTTIGLNLGQRFVPYDLSLSSYWGGEEIIAEIAIREARSQELTRLYEATVEADLMTRFSRRVMRILMQEADKIRAIRKSRDLTRQEVNALYDLLDKHHYYYERFEYYLGKLDHSAEAELYNHFWYYDQTTKEVVDEDTGKHYTPFKKKQQ